MARTSIARTSIVLRAPSGRPRTPFYGPQAGQNPPSPLIGITAAG
jgi:hypothetical protein